MTWQTMESAPRDGTRVLMRYPILLGGGRVRWGACVAQFAGIGSYGEQWSADAGGMLCGRAAPSHWQPLPDVDVTQSDGGENALATALRERDEARSAVESANALLEIAVDRAERLTALIRRLRVERDEARAERDVAREGWSRAASARDIALGDRDARPAITPEDALRVLVLAMRRDDDGVAAEERVDAALRAHAERAPKAVPT